MNALPSLNGSVGYIFTSCDLDVKGSHDVRFKDMVERFKVYDHPRRPEGKEAEWLGGERVDTRGEYVPILPLGSLDSVPPYNCIDVYWHRLPVVRQTIHPNRPA